MSFMKLRRCILTSFTIVLSVVVLLLTLVGCSTSGDGPSTSIGTGDINGYARYVNQSDHSGIIISAESVDGDGMAVTIKQAIGTRSIASRTLAGQTTTDSGGAYSLTGIDEGIYTIYASSQDSLKKAVTTGVTVIAGKDVTAADLNLTPTGEILEVATLNEAGSGNLGIVVFIAGTSFSAMTDNSGACTISSVPAAMGYTLVASKEGYDSVTTSVNVTAGEETDVITLNLVPSTTLPGTGIISGTAKLNGEDSGNTGIFIYLLDTGYLTMTTKESGVFNIVDVAPGTYTVCASRVGYTPASVPSGPVSAGNTTYVGTLNLAPVNNPPQIQSINVLPEPVMNKVSLLCSAIDADGDPLVYSWTIAGLTGIATGSSA